MRFARAPADGADAVSVTYYRVVNPLVTAVLGSPFHRLLSSNTLILHFRGRRSGRRYRTPLSYHERHGILHCFAGVDHRWWRNLEAGEPVEVTLRGRRLCGVPAVTPRDQPAAVAQALADFLRAVPRDAPHSGVRLDGNGEPLAGDLRRAVPRHVHVAIRLSDSAAGSGEASAPGG